MTNDDDDWLNIDEPVADTQVSLTAPPAAVPVNYSDRLKLLESAWASLSDKQRVFLNTWRESRYNANRAMRALASGPYSVSKRTTISWQSNENYETVRRMWRGDAASDALDRDRLLARQDDIVETLLTPKPVLYQGGSTGHFEVEAGAASRANETLMKAAGMLKDKEIDVNIGIAGPALTIQVVQPNGSVLDATPKYVDVNLPSPSGS